MYLLIYIMLIINIEPAQYNFYVWCKKSYSIYIFIVQDEWYIIMGSSKMLPPQ